MKKLAIVFVLVLVLGGYILFQKINGQSTTTAKSPDITTNPTSSAGANPTNNATTSTSSAGSGSPIPSQAGGKAYKNGTYTGDTTDAFYGMMQVQVVVAGGKISDVQLLQFPNKPGHTAEVSNEALPILKQEVIQKQSAPVDIISGATQTSDAFNQSLASALAKAQ